MDFPTNKCIGRLPEGRVDIFLLSIGKDIRVIEASPADNTDLFATGTYKKTPQKSNASGAVTLIGIVIDVFLANVVIFFTNINQSFCQQTL